MLNPVEHTAIAYTNLYKVTTSDDEVEYWAVDDLTRIPSLRGELNSPDVIVESVGVLSIPITVKLVAGE
jgi:hypothetical protein